ncbi:MULTISPECIES: penicillin-binding transpeptidase domain-containing protein [unclassified Streptomyces]|uniref:penicillin-binding transpeptidase domain-containing protein n=1 Tax=unclassified Streptomyces TaxID=2593676 RepID=UPI00225C24E5|nr:MULTISPECIES: penicillin-binding transpeptidase domain-containing protein [unclassified Streptomyces]MCX4881345.1 penicillin-binding transpeptidase domain-containing protein [Streptomyces sp. NBC_00847]MCX5421395.1 penicillin-binding transpeptidase domain-containing protein [Streptomyces sp. NBC_00078]
MGNRRRVAERRKTKPAVVGGMIAVVIGGAGFGAYALYGGGAAADDRTATSSAGADHKAIKTGPLSAAEVKTAAQGFLAAWQQGKVTKAAAVTNDSAGATALLTGYTKDAHITGVTLTAGTRTGDTVPFSVKGTVSYKDTKKPLTYESSLTVVRSRTDGKPYVDWHASVVHPDLRDGDTLVTGESGTPPVKAYDRAGGELTAAKYPSLGPVLDGLREKYGKTAGGKAGIELRVLRGKESQKAKYSDKTLLALSKGTPGSVKTTLSPTLQAAAEQQVAKQARASAVVMRPSTGEILAVANTSHGFNVAFQGSLAPGSTMKIVTSTMLFEKDLVHPDDSHPCPKTYKLAGWTFHNDDDSEIKKGTFKLAFGASCNNAFINFAPKLSNGDLTQEAQQVYGLGMNNWAIGVPTFDGAVPVQSGAQMGASLIGQGGVRMNPLNMASVASTVEAGTFHQPYLVAPSVDNRTLAKASRTMSSKTQAELKEVMQYTAAYGTASKAMAGLGPNYGAKTGSAEVDGQKKPNGWFTAFRGDLVAAGVVQAGGHGGDTAGPIVAALLRMGG